jgi:hypothetical protein
VRKISPSPGFDSRTLQPVASLYKDYATPGPHVIMLLLLITIMVIIIIIIIIIIMTIPPPPPPKNDDKVLHALG